ncbi:putative protein OS=Streptomyces fumanus OX=67302 GN=GCM10018772_34050 PE=4 SV=1 [Streptomyces fumanus]|uniref:Uncharacterized protein n=1 Tax=Streptomyces fumanus TaxID=67302 RepID=A0A919E2X9_9ACTN|nr:hypothetical protein GCM10018772_34050 [Streptomyces fumanus]
MRIAVTGSIATDHLMVFPGRFADQSLHDRIANLLAVHERVRGRPAAGTHRPWAGGGPYRGGHLGHPLGERGVRLARAGLPDLDVPALPDALLADVRSA